MNGSAVPAANLNFGAAIAALWIGLLYMVKANTMIIIPDEVFTLSPPAVSYLAAHFWDWKTGDNKPSAN
jgi:hypothetical protein